MAEHLEWFAAQHKQQNEAAKDYPETLEGRKIFDAACKGDDKELKRLLRKYGDRVKYLLEERVNGQTALMAACAKGLTKCARLLMETPTAVVAEDDKGRTPLHLAASNGHADCVSELYICGAEMENADERGFTAAHCAAGPMLAMDESLGETPQKSTHTSTERTVTNMNRLPPSVTQRICEIFRSRLTGSSTAVMMTVYTRLSSTTPALFKAAPVLVEMS